MDENDKLAMYEAMAIAVEQRIEIDRLKKEKEELAERLRRLQVGTPEKPEERSKINLDDVWKAVENLQLRIKADVGELQQTIHQNNIKFGQVETTLSQLEEKMEKKLEDRLKKHGLGEEECACHPDSAGSLNNKFHEVWTAINKLQEQTQKKANNVRKQQNEILRSLPSLFCPPSTASPPPSVTPLALPFPRPSPPPSVPPQLRTANNLKREMKKFALAWSKINSDQKI